MLGKNLFKVESKIELSNERFKTLVIFYCPLIGNDALALYEFLVVKGDSFGYEELNKLLNSLNISVDRFEEMINKLNQYKLVQTLKDNNDEKYIFVLKNPLTEDEFIKNDILVREFILKTSGEYYQSIVAGYRSPNEHINYTDVSSKLDPNDLANWNKNNEKYLNAINIGVKYDFHTLFDVNEFLADMSNNLMPLKYRTEENLKEIAMLADLYNISIDKMRTFIPKVAKSDSENFDLNLLRYLCSSSLPDYKTIKEGEYNVPCILFLMNKQDGKEVSKFDRKIIYSLANNYHLNTEVINVLLEYCLKNCDNRLIEKYVFGIASDLNRNGIDNADKALEFLNSFKKSNSKVKTVEAVPDYNQNNNPSYNDDLFNEIMNKRAK